MVTKVFLSFIFFSNLDSTVVGMLHIFSPPCSKWCNCDKIQLICELKSYSKFGTISVICWNVIIEQLLKINLL